MVILDMALSRSSPFDIGNVLICKLRVNCRKERPWRKSVYGVLCTTYCEAISRLYLGIALPSYFVIHLRSLIGWN